MIQVSNSNCAPTAECTIANTLEQTITFKKRVINDGVVVTGSSRDRLLALAAGDDDEAKLVIAGLGKRTDAVDASRDDLDAEAGNILNTRGVLSVADITVDLEKVNIGDI